MEEKKRDGGWALRREVDAWINRCVDRCVSAYVGMWTDIQISGRFDTQRDRGR